jgi:hypothetical protein
MAAHRKQATGEVPKDDHDEITDHPGDLTVDACE